MLGQLNLMAGEVTRLRVTEAAKGIPLTVVVIPRTHS